MKKNRVTKIILGVLWGLGLACIFRCACNGLKCIIYKAPLPKYIENNIYSHYEILYKFSN